MRVPFSGKRFAKSDVITASELVRTTWEVRAGRNAKACIGAVFAAVKRIERKLPAEVLRDRPRQWTERRVETIWKAQARRIDNYEMIDLERAALEAARNEFRDSINRAERLASFIASHEETEDSQLAERLREFVGGVGGAGAQV